eukprot:6648400-Lingulodinium_polyedra.AAC.1
MPSPLDVPVCCVRRRCGQDVQAPVAARAPMRATLQRDGAQAKPLQPPLDCPARLASSGSRGWS